MFDFRNSVTAHVSLGLPPPPSPLPRRCSRLRLFIRGRVMFLRTLCVVPWALFAAAITAVVAKLAIRLRTCCRRPRAVSVSALLAVEIVKHPTVLVCRSGRRRPIMASSGRGESRVHRHPRPSSPRSHGVRTLRLTVHMRARRCSRCSSS
jgi:hypothetical protein